MNTGNASIWDVIVVMTVMILIATILAIVFNPIFVGTPADVEPISITTESLE